jgi:KaiC/GvpD/RAD55 family RecA-like ATPase
VPDLFDFREDFQDLLLATMARHTKEFAYVAAALKPKYFAGVQPTLAARCMLEHAEKYNRYPTWVVLEQRLDEETRQLPEAEAGLAHDYVNKLKSLDTADWQYVRDRVGSWLRERALVNAIRESVGLLQEGKVPKDGFASLFMQAMQVGQNLEDLGYVLGDPRDIDDVVGKVVNQDYGLSTGFGELDAIWRRGWGPGWLVVPAAPPKRYKTGFCINLAVNVASPAVGEDVIYYACEINQELAMVRAMCNLAQLPEDYLYENPQKFTLDVKAAARDKLKKTLLFKSFPSKNATIGDLRAHAHTAKAQLGINPRLIVIDFAETIMPSNKRDAEYRQQSSIYVEARALAGEFGATVVMPDRVNRETVDQPVPDARALQGSFEKAGIVDVAFGLCATDEEFLQHQIRFFNFLNRHGPAFQHLRGRVDPRTWTMTFMERIAYDPAEAEKQRKKKSERLRRPPMSAMAEPLN